MIVKNVARVKTFNFRFIYQVGMVEIGNIFINLRNSSENNFTNFPWKRYELLFSFFRKGVKLEFVLSIYLNNKQFIRYIIWKKNRFFVRIENPDDIVILHFFLNSFPFQKK
jgi:hypothetical protein